MLGSFVNDFPKNEVTQKAVPLNRLGKDCGVTHTVTESIWSIRLCTIDNAFDMDNARSVFGNSSVAKWQPLVTTQPVV